jgi:hypothetical protein
VAPSQAVQLTVKELVSMSATLTVGIEVGAAATATLTTCVATPALLPAVKVNVLRPHVVRRRRVVQLRPSPP